MKQLFVTIALAAVSLASTAQEYHIWEDQHVLSQNREPARADFIPFETAKGDRAISLDGEWKFNWTKTPDEQPADFYRTDFDDSAWGTFPVPGDWEVNWLLLDPNNHSTLNTQHSTLKTAFGTPIYSSSGYTFKINPPYVMTTPKETYTAFVERNPTGCYRRWVNIPAEWQGKEIHLRFGSVASAFELYVNGKYVGYSQGSMEPAEFSLSPTLSKGEGDLRMLVALKVYKYCDGSYLEDQDQWRLGGIHRSITMFTTDNIRIRDIGVRTEGGRLTVHPELSVSAGFKGTGAEYALTAELYDADGNKVNTNEMSAPVDSMLNLNAKGGILNARTPQRGYATWGWMKCEIEKPKLWSAETPYLYTLRLTLSEKESGRVIEKAEQKVGFRDIKIKDGMLLVNGKQVRLRGVNRHEFSSTLGKVMTEEDMLRDILLMKRGNVNAVRTCHYPNTERWYELCDSLGLYVMDEIDIEEHGLRGKLAQEPEWTAAFIDRTQRCVIRDRNHPSVIMWSLGNESGYGPNFAACSQWIREYDPTRPIHYEGAQGEGGNDPQTVDVISRFYPRTLDEYLNPGVKDNNMERPENARWERLLALAQAEDARVKANLRPSPRSGGDGGGLPVLTSEYAHAMGNALGNFKEYWDEIYSNPRMLGGFIWEWADGEIKVLREDGKVMAAYGGDFGDVPNLKAFCVKGIVTSDRQETTKYQEMKKVYSPIVIRPVGEANASKLMANGYEMVSRDEHIDLNDYELVVEKDKKYGYENVFVKLAVDKPWAKKGHIVTWEQNPTPTLPTRGERPKNISKKKLTITQDSEGNILLSLPCGEDRGGVSPHLFRAPTDNDKGFGNWIAREWTLAGLDTAKSVNSRINKTLVDGGEQVTWTATTRLKEGAVITDFIATINKKGECDLQATFNFEGNLPPLPCLGITIKTPRQLNVPANKGNLTPSPRSGGAGGGLVVWHGLGPMDTYPDRTAAAMMGEWSLPLSEMYTHYARPQDSGNHGNTYWLSVPCDFVAGSKRALLIEALDKPFTFSALPYSIHQLATVTHDCDLTEEPYTFINIDCAQMGVGNSSCGPGVLTKYSIDQTQKHTLHIKIK